MGVSSFDKISQVLVKTKEFEEYKKDLRAALETATITGWSFQDRGVEQPTVMLNVEVKDFYERSQIAGPETVYLPPVYNLVKEEGLCDRVFKPNFGKKWCPTYNCRASKARDEFTTHAQNTIERDFKPLLEETRNRLKEQALVLLADPKLVQERTEFHERCVVEDIKRVLLKYKDIATSHTYKLALDEFVAHEIMES